MYDKTNPSVSADLVKNSLSAITKYNKPSSVMSSPDNGYESDDDEFQKEGIPTILFCEETTSDPSTGSITRNSYLDTIDTIDFNGYFPKSVRSILVAVAAAAKPIKK
jgi:hypothetical protein